MSIFGSDPFGATPFASWSGDDGTVYTLGTTTVVFQGFAPIITGPNPIKASQVWRETMLSRVAPVRASQIVREAMYAKADPPVRASQITRETMLSRVAPVRTSQLWREVMRSGTTIPESGYLCILW